MRSLIMLILFVGMFFIVQGFYEAKIREIERNPPIEYRYIPQDEFDQQLESGASQSFRPRPIG